MKFKVSGVYSLILVLVAFSSLVSMFALTRIDNMIKQDLYRYGLRFSYEWATPYWTLSSLVFVMGWADIILACAFQFYVLLYGRKKEEVIAQKEALKPETTQPPIEEKPIEAEEKKVAEPKPEEMKPAETEEAEPEETIAPPMEVELGVQEEEEAQKLAEEPLPTPIEASLETPEKGEEAAAATVGAEVGTAMETTITETMQPQGPTAPQQLIVCRICGAKNPIGTEFCEYCGLSLVPEVEGQREQKAELRETVETETQETPPPTPEIEEETTKRKKRPKRKLLGRPRRGRKTK